MVSCESSGSNSHSLYPPNGSGSLNGGGGGGNTLRKTAIGQGLVPPLYRDRSMGHREGGGRRSFLEENLAQLCNCKKVGFKYTAQQELTIRVGLFLFNQ